MSTPFSPDELRVLMLRHLEGQASPEDAHQLSAVLRDSAEARREYAALARQRALLFELAEERKVVVLDKPRFEAKSMPRIRWPRLAWAAGFVLVAALAALLLPGRLKSRPATASIEAWQGEVRFVSASGQTARAPALKDRFPPEASVETVGAESSVILVFSDGTRVSVGGNSALANVSEPRSHGRRLHLERGALEAVVTKTVPDAPVVFATPEAEATVLGTNLKLSRRAPLTRLEVREGEVRLRRPRDGAEIIVKARQFIEVSRDNKLRVLPVGQ